MSEIFNKEKFAALFSIQSQKLAFQIFEETKKLYQKEHRFYHNWNHISNLFNEIEKRYTVHEHKSILLLSALFHDVIYLPGSKKNEEFSAKHANEKLLLLNFPNDQLEVVIECVLATKKHNVSNDKIVVNIFCELDLLILAESQDLYSEYARSVRKEYSKYPSFIYNAGRKKALQELLSKFPLFTQLNNSESLNKKALYNIQQEINSL